MEYKSQNVVCQNCKTQFTIEPEDFKFYEKMKVPPPTWCPECRMMRRMLFRNERALYKRKCDLCSSVTFSIFSEKSHLKTYCQQCWLSDKWDANSFAEDVDFSKSLFEQLGQLYKKVPRRALHNVSSVKSDYCNINVNLKNCYLVFGSGFNEDCLFGDTLFKCKNVIDGSWSTGCEQSAFLIDCNKCYGVLLSQNCQNCIGSLLLYDCNNCQNCILSSSLRNKSYYVRNKQVGKDVFEKERAEILGSHKKLQRALFEFNKMKVSTIHRYMFGKNYINSSGNFIVNSKNVKNSYFMTDSEDVVNCVKSVRQKHALDGFGSSLGEFTYDTMNADYCSNSNFVVNGDYIAFSSYIIDGQNNSNCFACIGLRNKQYCILNKQYTKEEYEELVPKIIQHMNDMPYIDAKGRIYKYGEFFPPELSPFCYNETIAQEYFPLTKEEALKQGYKWKEKEARNYQIDIKNEDIPDNIKEVDDSIINKVIECVNNSDAQRGRSPDQNASGCTEAFKIIEDEYKFYQRMNLPIPHLCPNCRHYNRLKQRNPLRLWHRQCMCENKHDHLDIRCPSEFETSYSPDRLEIVYCERCYNQEVY